MSASTVIAIQAQQQAIEAKITSCKGIEQSFDNTTATVVQQRQYAECVQLLHPTGFSPTGFLLLKLAIALIFIGCGIGAIIGWKGDGWMGSILGFIAGGGAIFVAEIILWLIGCGILILLS